MKLYYYRTVIRNFGDDLNQWLWPRLIPELLDPSDGYLFVGIGTILNRRVPELPHKVVFGTGVGYGPRPVLDDNWTFYCVRGPLTAAALQLAPDMAITDPAILVGTLGDLPRATAHGGIAFMPHFETSIRAEFDGLNLRAVCADADITFIDPGGEVDEVLAAIRGCEVVVAEAMHGAIIADALRVPWVPVRCYDHILDFKWRDWCESLQLPYEPAMLDPTNLNVRGVTRFLKSFTSNPRSVMSADAIACTATERLLERLELLRRDYPNFDQSRRRPRGGAEADEQRTPHYDWTDARQWWKTIHDTDTAIDSVVPPQDAVIFVDNGLWMHQLSSRRKLVPFLERDGQYWGPPSDSETAIQELERLRAAGARFIIFAQPAFWWLDFYAEFGAYLRSSYRLALNDDRLIAFALDS